MKSLKRKAMLVAWCSGIVLNCALVYGDAQGNDSSSTDTPKQTSKMRLRKLGTLLGSQLLGVDTPPAEDQSPPVSSDMPSRATPRASSGHDPKQLAIYTAKASADEALASGKVFTVHVPKNAADRAVGDAACAKGPRQFYGWFYGPEAAKNISDGTPWQSMGIDGPTFCNAVIEAYQKAQGSVQTASPSNVNAQLLALEASQWADLDRSAKEHHAKLTPGVRWPRNKAEQFDLNQAAKKGTKACLQWIYVDKDLNGAGDKKFPTQGPSPELQCNQMAMEAKYMN